MALTIVSVITSVIVLKTLRAWVEMKHQPYKMCICITKMFHCGLIAIYQINKSEMGNIMIKEAIKWKEIFINL